MTKGGVLQRTKEKQMTTETKEGLDLRNYPWPKVTGLDVIFPTANTDQALLAEARRRGYDDYPEKPGIQMFNTLFYDGMLWMLFAGPFALRRVIRRSRGQCARCAYPIGTNERCTECGASVQSRGNASRSGQGRSRAGDG